MSKINSITHSTQFRISAFGLCIAILGAVMSFVAWNALGSEILAKFGFFFVVFGVVATIIGIVWGQIRYGRDAITRSSEAANSLKDKFGATRLQRSQNAKKAE